MLGNTPRSVLWVARNCDGVTRKASKEDCAGVDENAPVAKPALDTNKAAILTSILQTVVSDGTGKRAALGDRVVAGKTGTTENYGDACSSATRRSSRSRSGSATRKSSGRC